MNCWHCNSELIWSNDFSYEEWFCDDSREGIVTVLSCPECECTVEVYLDLDEEN